MSARLFRWLQALLAAIIVGLLLGWALVDLSYDFPVREPTAEQVKPCIPPMRCPP